MWKLCLGPKFRKEHRTLGGHQFFFFVLYSTNPHRFQHGTRDSRGVQCSGHGSTTSAREDDSWVPGEGARRCAKTTVLSLFFVPSSSHRVGPGHPLLNFFDENLVLCLLVNHGGKKSNKIFSQSGVTFLALFTREELFSRT